MSCLFSKGRWLSLRSPGSISQPMNWFWFWFWFVWITVAESIHVQHPFFETFLICHNPLPPNLFVDSELIERGSSSYYSCTITDVIICLNPSKWPFMPRACFEVSSKMENLQKKGEKQRPIRGAICMKQWGWGAGRQWRLLPPPPPCNINSSPLIF